MITRLTSEGYTQTQRKLADLEQRTVRLVELRESMQEGRAMYEECVAQDGSVKESDLSGLSC